MKHLLRRSVGNPTQVALLAIAVVMVMSHLGFLPGWSHPNDRCEQAAEAAESALPLPYMPNKSFDPVFLRVSGTRYAIPGNYFRYPPIGCDTEEGGFLLRVLLPTFEGWTRENREQMEGRDGGPQMTMNVLLNATRPGLEPDADLLHAFGVYAKGADPFGHYPVENGFFRTNSDRGSDIFFKREGSVVSLLIDCSPKQPPFRNPQCAQFSWYRDSTLKITYARIHLSKSEEIQRGAEAMLDAFVERAK
ncbi:hypothetical protein [Amaricoccus macauensis]|uniref:hypothetical protein n=1 Tax=Amaricoccus macauensis TaxID=57001 RepID=UPI003C7EA4B6